MPIKFFDRIKIFRSTEEKVKEMTDLEKEKFFEKKTINEIASIVSKMKSDDAADTLKIFEIKKSKRIIKLMVNKKAEEITELMEFPEDVAGSLMQKEFVSMREDSTVVDAIKKIRIYKDENLHDIYATDSKGMLVGVVSIRKLAIGRPKNKLSEIMKNEVISAFENEPLENVLSSMKKFDLFSLPVVNRKLEIEGVITIDDVIDVIEEEDTEDIYKLAGISGEPEEYFALDLKTKIAKRMPWIIVFMVVETFAAIMLSFYEDMLIEAIALAFFIPLLIATGGNVGSQAATLSVRGMATGEIDQKKAVSTIMNEMKTTFVLSLLIAGIAFTIGIFRANIFNIALAIGVAMWGITMVANLAGLVLPFTFKKLNIDPAVASAPLITTIADTAGIFIYFEVAKIFLGM